MASCEAVSRQLPEALENTKPEEVKAQVQDGGLMVTIRKMEKPKPNIRKIEITSKSDIIAMSITSCKDVVHQFNL